MSRTTNTTFQLLFFALTLFITCANGENEVTPKVTLDDNEIEFEPIHLDSAETTILFVGNSLTYSNDLPQILQMIASTYSESVGTTCICKPNYAIIDHIEDGSIKRALDQHHYDYVIMQQGPSSQPYGRELLIDAAHQIKALENNYLFKSAFYMVWPSVNYYNTFDGVIESYSLAADETESILLPVGMVWKEYSKNLNNKSLYGPDLFHPSLKGSFLAAWVMFHTLYPDLERSYHKNYSSYLSKRDLTKINEAMDAALVE